MDKAAEAILKRHEDGLLDLPNVVAVGLGEQAGKTVIKVFVEKKVPRSELPTSEVIPAEIEGIGVEVDVIGSVTAHRADMGKEDPP